jgi:opacity protein-like surface antigen
MRKLLCIISVLFVFAGVASAQKSVAPKHNFDKYEVYVGYDFDRSFGDYNGFHSSMANNDNLYSPFSLNGGQVTAAYFPLKNFGVKAAFSYSRKQGSMSSYPAEQEVNISRSYLVGPVVRWTVPSVVGGRVNVFAHELLGANQYAMNLDYKGKSVGCNDNGEACRAAGFATVTGGGVNVRINRYLSVRPAELDYWNHQINMDHFAGGSSDPVVDNATLSANGFRYSAGVSLNF